MKRKFYDLFDDIRFVRKWALHTPIKENGEEEYFDFDTAIFYNQKSKLICRISKEWRKGEPADFAIGGLNTPFISKRFGEVVESVAPNDIQRIPVIIEGFEEGEYEILNVLTLLDCFDYEKSDYLTNTDDGGNRYIKIRAVHKLKVDLSKIPEGVEIFRISNWKPPLLISEKVKTALDEAGLTKGVTFKRV